METQIIIAVISAVTAIVVATITKTELFSRRLSGLSKDIRLYNDLPSESKSKDPLLAFIDQRISDYIVTSTEHRRNAAEVITGIVVLIASLAVSLLLNSLGSWWQLGYSVTGFFLLVGVVGIAQGLRKVERDEKGNPVKKK